VGIQILDEKLVERIERLARQEQCPEEQVVAHAIHLYEKEAQVGYTSSLLLSIAKLGSCEHGDIAERERDPFI
jgi:hypothetical protein